MKRIVMFVVAIVMAGAQDTEKNITFRSGSGVGYLLKITPPRCESCNFETMDFSKLYSEESKWAFCIEGKEYTLNGKRLSELVRADRKEDGRP